MGVTRVRFVSSGGPAGPAATDHSVPVAELEGTHRIRHRPGYEHVVHDGDFRTVDGTGVAVLHRRHRTKIAE